MKLLNTLAFSVTLAGLIFNTIVSHAHGGDHAHDKVKDLPALPFSLDFIENEGQWDDQAKYKAIKGAASVIITQDGFMHNYASQEDFDRIHEGTCGPNADHNLDLSNEIIRQHAYRVRFE